MKLTSLLISTCVYHAVYEIFIDKFSSIRLSVTTKKIFPFKLLYHFQTICSAINTIIILMCKAITKILNFKKEIGIERYAQFTTVTLIMKKVLKQHEQVNLL